MCPTSGVSRSNLDLVFPVHLDKTSTTPKETILLTDLPTATTLAVPIGPEELVLLTGPDIEDMVKTAFAAQTTAKQGAVRRNREGLYSPP